MAREIVLLEIPPTEVRGVDGQTYLKSADGTLFKGGEVAFQPALIPAALGELAMFVEGGASENS